MKKNLLLVLAVLVVAALFGFIADLLQAALIVIVIVAVLGAAAGFGIWHVVKKRVERHTA